MNKNWLMFGVFFTYPFWGTFLTIMFSHYFRSMESTFVLVGTIGLVLSAFPIFFLKNTETLLKFLFAFAYYVGSIIVVFLFGWQTLFWFGGGY